MENTTSTIVTSTREPFFSADWHLFHKGVTEKCGRPWSEENNVASIVAAQRRKATSEKDTTYHIGDFAFSSDYGLVRQVAMAFRGRLMLIPGNHDKQGMLQKLADESHGKIVLLPSYVEIKLRRKLICMLHFPMEVWNRSHYGSFHLHGHCHGNMDQSGKGKRLDVGIDASKDWSMFSTSEIFDYMETVDIYDPESRAKR